MNRAKVFTWKEFEELIEEITYGTMNVGYDISDGWFFTERYFDTDEEYNEWLKEYGEDVETEVNSFENKEEFVYCMIDRKFDAVLQSIIVDIYADAVAVIFKEED